MGDSKYMFSNRKTFLILSLSFIYNFGLSLTNSANATEVDNFTPGLIRPQQKDALIGLNIITQRYLNKCVDSLNEKMKNSKNQPLKTLEVYKICHDILGSSTPWAKIEVELSKTTEIETVFLKKEESIYSSLNLSDGFGLKFASLGNTMKIGNYSIGIDKVGHFIDQGYQYFTINYVEKKGLLKALENGEYQEKTYYGFWSTGVYSYGDLNANYRGMKFWYELFRNEYNQVDDNTFEPYIVFDESLGKWQLNINRPFDWGPHIDGAMDESINCSVYKNQSIQNKINKKFQELSAQYKAKVTCPISHDECVMIRNNAQDENFNESIDLTKRLVSPICLES
jgi:hypothetical protein